MASEPATPKKRSYTKRPVRTAYSITLPFGRSMDVKESANAWWVEQGKVERLLAALGIDASVEEACDYAEITVRQYKYFLRLHPDFRDIRKRLISRNTMRARHTIIKELEQGDYWKNMDYLKRRVPEQFGPPSRKSKVSPADLPPLRFGIIDENRRLVEVDPKTWLPIGMKKSKKKVETLLPAPEPVQTPEVPKYETELYHPDKFKDVKYLD